MELGRLRQPPQFGTTAALSPLFNFGHNPAKGEADIEGGVGEAKGERAPDIRAWAEAGTPWRCLGYRVARSLKSNAIK